MSKVKHIIAREYLTRVRKKSFIVMTILGPLLFAAMLIAPIWLTQLEDNEAKTIVVVEYDRFGEPVPDSLLVFKGVFQNKPLLTFEYHGGLAETMVESLAKESNYYGFLKIRHNVIFSGQDVSVEFLSKEHPSLGLELQLTSTLENYLQSRKLLTYNVPPEVLKSLKTHVSLSSKLLDKDGFKDKGNVNLKRIVGYVCSMLIYGFIFYFGSQVMRGVVEEKTNRIIEVIITSVKPFQLMLGKIVGIGLVGLTQFLAWILLTILIFQGASSFLMREKMNDVEAMQNQPTELFESTPAADVATIEEPEFDFSGMIEMVKDIDIVLIFGLFLFYFLGGYLLYAAMFAAIGSAVDNETDSQQFMFPVTIPLIISIIVMANAISDPSGSVAFWFSMIPFTSPIIMMARIPFGVPAWQVVASMHILIATFILLTWLAGKIYRTGILMYGKKPNLKEILKWMRYQ
ncbi:MAG: ABC transporter permease [Bacteroidota bacterium]|nr:MAG: ABC transporter permease [Bacteroidota bacterium]